MIDMPELNGFDLYALRDGPNMDQYKFGYEAGTQDNTKTLAILKRYFPSKYEKIINVQPCSYAMTDNRRLYI